MKKNQKYSHASAQDTPGQTAEDLKKRIQLCRKELHYSQVELAQRSGVSYGSIKRFERFNEISLASLLKIAMALGCLPDFTHLFACPHNEITPEGFDGNKAPDYRYLREGEPNTKLLSFEQIRTLVLDVLSFRPQAFKRVYLVGSYAKGTADKQSDIDLLVYAAKDSDIGDLGYLQYVLSQKSGKDVDVIDARGASKSFLTSVSKGRILIYQKE